MRLLIILIGLFYGIHLQAQSPPQLVLLNKNNIITRFEEGETIRFKKRGDDFFTKSIIQGIHSGFLTFGDDSINFYDIEKIDIRNKPLTTFRLSTMGKTMMVAGTLLFTIDFFNQKAIQNKDYESDTAIVWGGSILIGFGAFLQLVNNDYFKVHRRRKLAAINL